MRKVLRVAKYAAYAGFWVLAAALLLSTQSGCDEEWIIKQWANYWPDGQVIGRP